MRTLLSLKGILGLALLAMLVWWGASAYTTHQVNLQLRQALVQQGMQNQLSWQTLRATPFGVVTLENVHFTLPRQAGQWQAASLKVSQVINRPDRRRAHVFVRGLTETSGQADAYQWGQALGLPLHQRQWLPLDAQIEVDVRHADDQADLAMYVRQDTGTQAGYRATLTHVQPLQGLVDLALAGLAADAPRQNGLNMLGSLTALAQLRLASTQISLFDPLPLTDQDLTDWVRTCQRQGMALLTQSPQETCHATAQYLSGQADTLRIDVAPQAPMPFGHFLPVLFGRPSPALAQALNVTVSQ